MRAICDTCSFLCNCRFLDNNKESDCLGVQTFDYGYKEATDKAIKVFSSCMYSAVKNNILTQELAEENIEEFKKAMEL